MKKLLTYTYIALCLSSFAQTTNPDYDEKLAIELGADDYGMKAYIFVMLKTGSNNSEDKALRDSCFKTHFSNMDSLVKKKKLIVAGPMFDNDQDIRGLFILDAKTETEADSMLLGDKAIQEGFLRAEFLKWYGSAALPVYLEASDKVWKVAP